MKITKSIQCPFCSSSNIKFDIHHVEQKESVEENATTNEKTWRKVYECECQDCHKKYTVDYGKEKLTYYCPESAESYISDVQLIMQFESESDRNYKVVAINNPREGIEEDTYLVITEDDCYPYIINKETAKDDAKIKSLLFNAYLDRHR